jgi:hypothetical protein
MSDGPTGNGVKGWRRLRCDACKASVSRSPGPVRPRAVREFAAEHRGHAIRGQHNATGLWIELGDAFTGDESPAAEP